MFGVASSAPAVLSGLQWLERRLWWLRRFSKALGRSEVALGWSEVSVRVVFCRVMHILSGHDKRELAKDYVW